MSIQKLESSNIKVNGDEKDYTNFPKDSTIQVKYENGKKEGNAIVLSAKKTRLAQLHYHQGILEGYCVFYDENGRKMKEAMFENGIHNGWGCEYQNSEVIFIGIYKDGKRYSKLQEYSYNPSFLQESIDNEIISVCKYNENHKKDGLCYFYKNGKVNRVTCFENGIEKNTIQEFKGKAMIEYDKNGKMSYQGQYTGRISNGFKPSGKGNCYEYSKDQLIQIKKMDNTKQIGKIVFEGEKMKEYSYDQLVYEGGFIQVDKEYARNGYGCVYLSSISYYDAIFDKGVEKRKIQEFNNNQMIEYDNEGNAVYNGYFMKKKDKIEKTGDGYIFKYEKNILKEVYHSQNGHETFKCYSFEKSNSPFLSVMNEYTANGILKYKGGYDGSPLIGFTRDGKGDEYDENEMLMYSGNWKKNKRNGHGLYYQNTILYYEGDWIDDIPEGRGKLLNDEGDVEYNGEWKKGYYIIKKGYGIHYQTKQMVEFYYDYTIKYEGEWKEYDYHGKGKLYYENGQLKYEGSFVYGYYDGEGIEYELNGKVKYNGMWKRGQYNGYGKKYNNGILIYDGNWDMGRYEGKGKEYYPNGKLKYDGEWRSGKYWGEGKEYDLNEAVKYEGWWKEGIPEGHGKYYENGKVKYEGEWKRGEVYSWMILGWFDYQSGKRTGAIGWLWDEYLWELLWKGYISIGLMIFSSIMIIVLAATGKSSESNCSDRWHSWCDCQKDDIVLYYNLIGIPFLVVALIFVLFWTCHCSKEGYVLSYTVFFSIFGFCLIFIVIHFFIECVGMCSSYYNHFASSTVFFVICIITFIHLLILGSKRKGSICDTPDCQGCCGKVYDNYDLSFCSPVYFYSTNNTHQFLSNNKIIIITNNTLSRWFLCKTT